MRRTLTLALLLTLAASSCAWIARASVDSNGAEANSASGFRGLAANGLSAGGDVVTFTSFASNLVPGDTNGLSDVFRRDNRTGDVTRITDTDPSTNGGPEWPSTSTDGRYVTYSTFDLDAGAGFAVGDVFR